MKSILFASAAVLALTVGASAADLTYEPAPAPVIAAPMFDWTGFYAGVHAGGVWGDYDGAAAIGPIGYGDLIGNVSNAIGGAQIGYNYQINQFVIGAQTDIAYTSLKGSAVIVPGIEAQASTNWIGSTTLRAGYAMDTWLFYGKGGLAYGNVKTGINNVTNDNWTTGWTAGLGVEKAFTKNLTGFLEYDYFDLGDQVITTPLATSTVGLTTNVVKVGVNYKF